MSSARINRTFGRSAADVTAAATRSTNMVMSQRKEVVLNTLSRIVANPNVLSHGKTVSGGGCEAVYSGLYCTTEHRQVR
jgi:hypothetical protein